MSQPDPQPLPPAPTAAPDNTERLALWSVFCGLTPYFWLGCGFLLIYSLKVDKFVHDLYVEVPLPTKCTLFLFMNPVVAAAAALSLPLAWGLILAFAKTRRTRILLSVIFALCMLLLPLLGYVTLQLPLWNMLDTMGHQKH